MSLKLVAEKADTSSLFKAKRLTFLAVDNHIRKDDHFKYVFKNARKITTPTCFIYVADALNPKGMRAVVTSKKVGKAVTRNKVKRKMKECIRIHQHKIHPSKDMLFIARPLSKTSGFFQIEDHIMFGLQKHNLLQP